MVSVLEDIASLVNSGLTSKAKPLDINGRQIVSGGTYYRTSVAAAVNFALEEFYRLTGENSNGITYAQAEGILKESFADVWSKEELQN